jgi:hypothetical protein
MKMAIFWVVEPCSLVEDCRRFRSVCCLRHHGDETSANFYQSARRNNPEGGHLLNSRRKNLKFRFLNSSDIQMCKYVARR